MAELVASKAGRQSEGIRSNSLGTAWTSSGNVRQDFKAGVIVLQSSVCKVGFVVLQAVLALSLASLVLLAAGKELIGIAHCIARPATFLRGVSGEFSLLQAPQPLVQQSVRPNTLFGITDDLTKRTKKSMSR